MRAKFGLVLLMTATACQQSQPVIATPEEQTSSPTAASAGGNGGTPIDVPSDPRAQYYLLSKEPMPNGHLQVITRRVGPSGESFARREVNCPSGTVRYIGEGDTLAEAQADSPNPGEMTAPVAESITGVITAYICG